MTTIKIDDKSFEPYLLYFQIEARVAAIAQQINMDYEDRQPVFLGVLSGSFFFMADLVKQTALDAEVNFVKLASYEGAKSSGKMEVQLGIHTDLKNRDVIIVEDIVDTGHTLNYLLDLIRKEKPASVRVCSLLYKPAACQIQFDELQYVGFEIPNEFVLGYGLDYNGKGRNLRDIYRLAVI